MGGREFRQLPAKLRAFIQNMMAGSVYFMPWDGRSPRNTPKWDPMPTPRKKEKRTNSMIGNHSAGPLGAVTPVGKML